MKKLISLRAISILLASPAFAAGEHQHDGDARAHAKDERHDGEDQNRN